MLEFNKYISRHGETGVQALLELIEHYEGISTQAAISLEERWNAVMNFNTASTNLKMAA